jgi:hypothetical protein
VIEAGKSVEDLPAKLFGAVDGVEGRQGADGVERGSDGLGRHEGTMVGGAEHHEPVHARAGALFQGGSGDESAHAVRHQVDLARQAVDVACELRSQLLDAVAPVITPEVGIETCGAQAQLELQVEQQHDAKRNYLGRTAGAQLQPGERAQRNILGIEPDRVVEAEQARVGDAELGSHDAGKDQHAFRVALHATLGGAPGPVLSTLRNRPHRSTWSAHPRGRRSTGPVLCRGFGAGNRRQSSGFQMPNYRWFAWVSAWFSWVMVLGSTARVRLTPLYSIQD